MSDGLTQQQLYADLVAAYKRAPIPEGAFTAEQFKQDAGISLSTAKEVLRNLELLGKATVYRDGRRNWYILVGGAETP